MLMPDAAMAAYAALACWRCSFTFRYDIRVYAMLIVDAAPRARLLWPTLLRRCLRAATLLY